MDGAFSELSEAAYVAGAADAHQVHVGDFAGLEPDAGSGRAIEPHAEGGCAVEFERAVHLEKMGMAAYLDRAIPGIEYVDGYALPPGVDLDLTLLGDDFAGDGFDGVRIHAGWLDCLRDAPALDRTAFQCVHHHPLIITSPHAR